MEGIDVTSVYVMGQNVTNSTFVSVRQRKLLDARLDLEALIGATGPNLDFHTTVQETFEKYEDVLVMELKQSQIEEINQVNSAFSAIVWDWDSDIDEDKCILKETNNAVETPSTTAPVAIESSEEVPFYRSSVGMAIIGSCGAVAIIAVMCIIKYSIVERSNSIDEKCPNNPNLLQETSFNRKGMSQRTMFTRASSGFSDEAENDLATILAEKYARQACSRNSSGGMF